MPGYGENWTEYSPPSVLNWFSKTTLKQVLLDHGFKFIKRGRPNKKISLNHALTLFEHKYPKFQFGTKFVEKMLGKKKISIFYPPLDVTWSLYRKI